MLLPRCAGPGATRLLWAQQNPAAEQMGRKGPPKESPQQRFLQEGVKSGPWGSVAPSLGRQQPLAASLSTTLPPRCSPQA